MAGSSSQTETKGKLLFKEMRFTVSRIQEYREEER